MKKDYYVFLSSPMPQDDVKVENNIYLNNSIFPIKKMPYSDMEKTLRYIECLKSHPAYYCYRYNSSFKKWMLFKTIEPKHEKNQ